LDGASVNRVDQLAEAYTRIRPRLIRLAYTVLGTHAEAEDVVSECWLRLAVADRREAILDVEAWAVVAVGRRALDVLSSARVQRQMYVGPWLPQPVLDSAVDPADQVTLDETVSFALLVVLETLTPAERTAWVLHDVFGLPFADVARVVGRRPDAVRQLAARARTHVRAATPRVDVDTAEHRQTVTAFFHAVENGDLAGLVAVLDPAARVTSDGGGLAGIARHPVQGADRVARFLLGITVNIRPGQRLVTTTVNGGTGFTLLDGDDVLLIGCLTTAGRHIHHIYLILAPAKLHTGRRRARTDQHDSGP
jgi:RNA polymerase sigma-70 factor (ECF subfamily)